MSELYLSSNRSEEGETHVNWLVYYLEEEAARVPLGKALVECYENPHQQEVVQVQQQATFAAVAEPKLGKFQSSASVFETSLEFPKWNETTPH